MLSYKKMTSQETLRKVFIRVYRLETSNFLRIFSHVGIFNPALWSVLSPVAPSPFLSGSTLPPPPLPCVNKYTVYTYTVCVGGGEGYGVLASDR